MTSVVELAPGVRPNPGSPQHLPENGYSSSSSSSSIRHPNSTPVMSPEKKGGEHRSTCRPQISVEQADYDAAMAVSTGGSSQSSPMHTSHSVPFPVGQRSSSSTSTDYPTLQSNSGSLLAQRNVNGVSPIPREKNLHLQVSHKAGKSRTLPLEITGLMDGLQSGQSSVCNSSDAEYDSDESSMHNPRDLLLNEHYWQDKRADILLAQGYHHHHKQGGSGMAGNRKVRRQKRMGSSVSVGIHGEGEEEEDEEEGEEGYNEEDFASEDSGDEDSGSTVPSFIPRGSTRQDDDVFHPDFCGGMEICCEADAKLMDWSYNVFVPACRTLLHHCREGGDTELSSSQILADLRSLSNTISFFCTEQQNLSSTQQPSRSVIGRTGNSRPGHGISASISTDRISRIRDMGSKTLDIHQRTDDMIVMGASSSIKTASMSSDSASSSGFESQDGSSYDRNYSVKILRSVSQSLIAPLIQEYELGFTPELYKSIVQAIQKIAWKVEACLAINDPSKVPEVYERIFDSEQQGNLAEKMINALPPEEPKLVTAVPPGRSSRTGSMSSAMRRTMSSGRTSLGVELDQTISSSNPSSVTAQARTTSGAQSSADTTRDLSASESSDATCVSSFLDSVSTTASIDHRHSSLSVVTDVFGEVSGAVDLSSVRRERMATFASPSRNSKAWNSFDEQDRNHAKCRLSSDQLECSMVDEPHYFRPKHVRRTTISLSRKEVSKLGWKVARKVDKSTSVLPEAGGSSSTSTPRTKRMHKTGNNSLSSLKRETKTESGSSIVKSASLSNLLDKPSSKSDKKTGADIAAGVSLRRKGRNRSHDADMLRDGGDKQEPMSPVLLQQQSSVDSTTVNDHLAKSYMPVTKQTSLPGTTSSSIDEEWTLVSPDAHAASVDSGKRLRTGSRNSKILIGGAARITKKARKAVVEKSLSASEKFTSRVKKTANALRRGSVSMVSSKEKKGATMVVSTTASMEDLQEEGVGVAPLEVGRAPLEVGRAPLGRPPRPTSTSEPPSPVVAKKSGTMPNKRSTLLRISKKTKSFGSSASLPRKNKKTAQQRTGFATATQIAPAEQAALTESIYQFSKNAVQPTFEDTEDQLLISVDMASKDASRLYRKRSSIISSSNSSSYIWYAITIATNMKKFGRQHYTIIRNLKQVNVLYNNIEEEYGSSGGIELPERPDKRTSTKIQREKVEKLLLYVVASSTLQSCEYVLDFMKPDEGFGTAAVNSETKLDLLMTFYTPDVYQGPPGSNHDVQLVNPEDVPDSLSSHSRHSGSSQRKKGTYKFVKNQEASSTFIIKEEGQDALIVACEEDRYMVVAGTFEKLVEQLACEENPDARFVMTFLLGYRHFAAPLELLTELLRRFHMTLAPNPTEEEVAYAEKWRYVIQLRVLDVIMYWLRKCWPDFYRVPAMLDRIREFIEELKASQDTNFQLAGNTLDKMVSDKLSISSAQYRISTVSEDTTDSTCSSVPSTPSHLQRSISSPGHTSPSPASPGRTHEMSSPRMEMKPRSPRISGQINIHTIPAIQLARQLTLVELEYLRAIDIHELVVYAWESNSEGNKPYRKHIDDYIRRFNQLSYWVSSEVCSTHDPHTRGALIEKFVEVAKYCHDCKNFNSTISIVSGLSLMAVRRLKKSWEFVSDKSVKTFHKLCQIMSPTNNHCAYRKHFNSTSRKDCIPYFGVFMRDITFFNDGNRKQLKNGLLNFSKLRSMVSKFEELKLYQRSKFLFTPDEKLLEYCRNLWCMTEQDLYEASEKLEPREVALPITTPTPTPTPTPATDSQQFDETDV